MPLLAFAQASVPFEARNATPIVLFGTAGVRMLHSAVQEAIYASALHTCERSGFRIDRSSFRTLSGEDEGYYGWLALALLAQHTPEASHVLGGLDLGGGSTQLSFVDMQVSGVLGTSTGLHRARERAFSRSHLGFGNRAALARVEAALRAPSDSRHERAQPCFFRGYSYAGTDGARFVGSSDPRRCAELIGELFLPDATPRFERGRPPPMGVAFYGMSAFFFIVNYLSFMKVLPGMPSPTLGAIREAAEALCAMPWTEVSAGPIDPYTTAEKLPMRCFDALYVVSLLEHGYGFAPGGNQVHFVEKLGNGVPDWPLGAALIAAVAAAQGDEEAPRAGIRKGLLLSASLVFVICAFSGCRTSIRSSALADSLASAEALSDNESGTEMAQCVGLLRSNGRKDGDGAL